MKLLQVCSDNTWAAVYAPPAGSQSNPGVTCKHILTTASGSVADGKYHINPGGGGMFEVFCDMTNGGWTLVYKKASSATFGLDHYYAHKSDMALSALASGPVASGGDNTDSRLGKDKMNRVFQNSMEFLARYDIGYKTAYVKRLGAGGATHSMFDGIFVKSNNWGARGGTGYQIYKTPSGTNKAFESPQECADTIVSTSSHHNNQGALGDPCGYGGCCWLFDKPAYQSHTKGSGCCSNCDPRGACNAYVWVR